MSQRQNGSQLRLVFGNSTTSTTDGTRLSSVPRRMLRADSPTSSRNKDSPFIKQMRALELMSPEHAPVLLGLAKDILDERRRRGWPPLE